MFEMSLSVALVGLITIIAVRSLGVELRGNVNKLTGTLNPSLLDAPQLTLEASPLELITSTGPINSKPAGVAKEPPTDAKPASLSGGVPQLR